MNFLNEVFRITRENKVSFVIGLVSSLAATSIWTYFANFFFSEDHSEQQFDLLLLTFILATLLVLVGIVIIYFNQLFNTENLLYEIYGSTWRNSQYYRRRGHFTQEKFRLARGLVKKILPKKLEEINSNHNCTQINIIIDSGSTLSPLFSFLPHMKVNKEIRDKIKFYTNNIAGITELHKSRYGRHKFKENDFILIGGNPLGEYMANTDEDPNETRKRFQEITNQAGHFNITILTSNWILGGNNFDELALCAKGRGHPEFKKVLLEISNFIFVAAPLGKILKIKAESDLKKIVGGDQYEIIPITNGKDKTCLVTTYRSEESLSPLKELSHQLFDKKDKQSHTRNYHFSNPSLFYKVSGKTKEVWATELPHHYISKHFRDAYGYSKPNK